MMWLCQLCRLGSRVGAGNYVAIKKIKHHVRGSACQSLSHRVTDGLACRRTTKASLRKLQQLIMRCCAVVLLCCVVVLLCFLSPHGMPNRVAVREIGVLRKLRHPSIVQLQRVRVRVLCLSRRTHSHVIVTCFSHLIMPCHFR